MSKTEDYTPKNIGMISGMRNAASYVGISPRLLFTWINQGRVRCIRHSKRKLFFRPSDLIKAVQEIGEDYAAKEGL